MTHTDRAEYLKEWARTNPESRSISHRKWRLKNKTERNAYMRAWNKANPEKARKHQRKNSLKRRYGMTSADYDMLLQIQGGTCALCPRTPVQCRYGVLAVDHDHATQKIRGLLCDPCNLALGRLGDTVDNLQRVLEYVKRSGT